MAKSNHRPAGGLKSRQVVHKPQQLGAGARGVDKKWVSQIGQSMGNHITERGEPVRGVRARDPYKGPSMNPTRYGNEIAAATVCGPGGSREVLKSGSQHGLTTRSNNPRGRSFDD
jgi:hypothetical protein